MSAPVHRRTSSYVYKGIEAFNAVALSLNPPTSPGASSPRASQYGGRLYIQIKTGLDGLGRASTTTKDKDASSFVVLTDFISKFLEREDLAKEDRAVILKVLGDEKKKVSLTTWDKIWKTDKKKAVDLANKLEKENAELVSRPSFISADFDKLVPPVFSPDFDEKDNSPLS